ncbi:MAG: hypothetical protein K8S20_09055 [Chloroflexi bacterium]|nr:hypothetical protein [Chloroflexota bacterium]
MNKPIVVPSPDKKRRAALTLLGKIQSGREYYSLSIDGVPLSLQNRVFGHVCLWSHDSRFLSVQEWKEFDPAAPPKSYLLMILDLLTRRECVVTEVEGAKSEVNPQGFIGDSLMYTVVYDGQFGTTKNFECNFQYLAGWQTLK